MRFITNKEKPKEAPIRVVVEEICGDVELTLEKGDLHYSVAYFRANRGELVVYKDRLLAVGLNVRCVE